MQRSPLATPRRWLAALACLATAATMASAAPTKSWTVTALPGGNYGGMARGINNHGDVVGTVEFPVHNARPVYWLDSPYTDLLDGYGGHGVANAINDHGVVAMTANFVVSTWKDRVTTSLGIVGEPLDINRSGAVVGYFYPSGQIAWGPQRGFYYKDGVVHDIGSLGNNLTAALGVNDKGVVVGYSRLPFSSTDRGIIWKDGVLTQLGTLGGQHSYAGDVTNRGVILGSADDANGINHMVTWDLNGNLLHDYGPRLGGSAINDRGAIVGTQLDTGRPFLLEDGVYTWLLDLPAMRDGGWVSFSPMDINEHGWIVGVGWRPGTPTGGAPLLLKPR